MLVPGLHPGWIVPPAPLVEPLCHAHRNPGLGASLHVQAALADVMESGAWRGHLRHLSRACAERGRWLADALENRLGARVTVRRSDGGLQLPVALASARAEAAAMAVLGAAGFAVAALSRFGCRIPGLVVGFADADSARIDRFVATLATALAGR